MQARMRSASPRHSRLRFQFAALLLSATPAAASGLIYHCTIDGQRTFSDRPCGDAPRLELIDLGRQSVFTAPSVPAAEPAAPSRSPSASRPSTPARAAPPDVRAAMRANCLALQARIDRIDSRMRLGYANRVGEKLKTERRELTERYTALRCNTTSR